MPNGIILYHFVLLIPNFVPDYDVIRDSSGYFLEYDFTMNSLGHFHKYDVIRGSLGHFPKNDGEEGRGCDITPRLQDGCQILEIMGRGKK